MKEFTIFALIYPSYTDFAIDVVLADNLRDAWRFFKQQNKNYTHLRFHSARTSERSYFKMY